jgi:hypothetical protein
MIAHDLVGGQIDQAVSISHAAVECAKEFSGG